MAFHIGQKVVCVWTCNSGHPYYEIHPIKGNVYTIREIVGWGGKNVGVRLIEIVNKPNLYRNHKGEIITSELLFNSISFRPVKTASIEIFHRMLKPVKEDA